MAYYDYACEKCKIINEIQHGMLEEPEILCEECGEPMKKLISDSVAVIYKCDGFYATERKAKQTTELVKRMRKDKYGPTGTPSQKDIMEMTGDTVGEINDDTV